MDAAGSCCQSSLSTRFALLALLVAWVVACQAEGHPTLDASQPRATAILDASIDDGAPATDANDGSIVDAAHDADVGEMSETAMRMLGDVATLVETHKSDCNKLGEQLDAYYDENGAFIREAKHTYFDLPRPEQAKVRQKYRPRFNATWKRLQPGMKSCKDNQKVKDILDKALPSP